MLNLILFGPPGSGKGTQSEKLIKRYNLVHLSTGDIFRNEISQNTALGSEAKSFMDKGELVPDIVVIRMIGSFIEKNLGCNGFIFDGFPRTLHQAETLDRFLEEKSLGINMLFALEVEKSILIERIQGRSLKSGRIDDSSIDVIENRLKVYHSQSHPIIGHYKKQDKYSLVTGKGSIEEIFSKICDIIDFKLSGNIIKN